MKYAIIEIGGEQIFIEEGKYYLINNLPQKVGSRLLLNRILLCNDNGRRIIGYPYIENSASVNIFATVLELYRNNKLIVFKMKPKKKISKTIGYRKTQTRIIIDRIETC